VDPEEIASLRTDYQTAGLSRSGLADDPYRQFEHWFEDALAAGVDQPNAFVLATATDDGTPSARAVLMKDMSDDGLVFYTNRDSRKGQELAANPRAAACFVWLPLHRQVRIEGVVGAVDDKSSDRYFRSRPLGARLAAAASPQSQVVPDRSALDRAYAELEERYPDGDVPRPPRWGGYAIVPSMFEFWQGRANRFHDRFRYSRQGDRWLIERLAP
jgi:pyridoxamine 5'-phosphate oxidase